MRRRKEPSVHSLPLEFQVHIPPHSHTDMTSSFRVSRKLPSLISAVGRQWKKKGEQRRGVAQR